MQAIVITAPGAPEVLQLREVKSPEPVGNQIQVRVRATALNRADLLQRRGLYPAPPGVAADIPGLEFAGEVAAIGSAVTMWKPGDRVMGLLAGGGYAEQIITHERLAMPIPETLYFEQAAAIPEVFLTAYDALFSQLELKAGERLLIHAAASGVGTAAIQMAKLAGITTFGTTRTTSKLALLDELALDHPIDTSTTNFTDAIHSLTNKQGVDAILDLVGASVWQGNMKALARKGRMIIVGMVGGVKVEADLSTILRKRLTVTGTVLRARPIEEKISLTQQFQKHMLPHFDTGKLRPIIDTTIDWQKVPQAHQLMEENKNSGKIVLRVN